jgi:hypothetical protein
MRNRNNQRGLSPIGNALSLGAVVLFVFASAAWAVHTVTKTEDVRNTKHYFVGNPDTQDQAQNPGTSEVCVFCHTPHGANQNVQGQAPLWNRRTPNIGFQPYSSPNLELGTAGQPKGISLGCLSCHDGTIALDALINAPGSGVFLAPNRDTEGPGGTSSGLITLSGPGISVDSLAEGDRDDTEDMTTPFSPFSGGLHDVVFQLDGSGSDAGMEPFPNLSQDLQDDHPISIQIPADGFTTDTSLRDPQFAPIGANSPPATTPGTSIKFITRSAGIFPFDLRDRLRAYPSAGGGSTDYFVECASCHNPHTPRPNFLRMPSFVPGLVTQQLDPTTPISGGIYDGEPWGQYPNNQSAICLSCHAK